MRTSTCELRYRKVNISPLSTPQTHTIQLTSKKKSSNTNKTSLKNHSIIAPLLPSPIPLPRGACFHSPNLPLKLPTSTVIIPPTNIDLTVSILLSKTSKAVAFLKVSVKHNTSYCSDWNLLFRQMRCCHGNTLCCPYPFPDTWPSLPECVQSAEQLI